MAAKKTNEEITKDLRKIQASIKKSREKMKQVTGPSRATLGVKESPPKKKTTGTFTWLKKQLGMFDKETKSTKKVSKATGGAIKSDVEKRKDRMKGK